jgi:hypothetical protein
VWQASAKSWNTSDHGLCDLVDHSLDKVIAVYNQPHWRNAGLSGDPTEPEGGNDRNP